MHFDNQSWLNKAGLGYGQTILDRAAGYGDAHFICQIGTLKLGYCYIRKNACSSFKKLILDQSETTFDPLKWPRPIDFMIEHHLMRSSDAAKCDRIVFVYRDPVKRLVSLFKNKFIMKDGHEDLFRRYESLAGERPEDTTFTRFVSNYLRPDMRSLDRHVTPQHRHLKRFRYTDAIAIDNLHAGMVPVVGQLLADKYFAKAVNTTMDAQTVDIRGAADLPTQKLADLYETQRTMPSNDSLLGQTTMHRIRTLYREDIDMIARIETAS